MHVDPKTGCFERKEFQYLTVRMSWWYVSKKKSLSFFPFPFSFSISHANMVCLFWSRKYTSNKVEAVVASNPTELLQHLYDHPSKISDGLERVLNRFERHESAGERDSESWYMYDGVIGIASSGFTMDGHIDVINCPDELVSEDGRAWLISNEFKAAVTTDPSRIETIKAEIEGKMGGRLSPKEFKVEVREVDIIGMPKSKSASKT